MNGRFALPPVGDGIHVREEDEIARAPGGEEHLRAGGRLFTPHPQLSALTRPF